MYLSCTIVSNGAARINQTGNPSLATYFIEYPVIVVIWEMTTCRGSESKLLVRELFGIFLTCNI
jgi:hypothetical protein